MFTFSQILKENHVEKDTVKKESPDLNSIKCQLIIYYVALWEDCFVV